METDGSTQQMAEPKNGTLTGHYHVRVCRPAFSEARRLCPHVGDLMELKAHALKLRYWPDGHAGEKVVDLDWDWIKACDGFRIGELRIDDKINGHDNLRIIFLKVNEKMPQEGLPAIWILRVMQKKTQRFSANDVRIFKARRMLVLHFYYGHSKAG